MTTIYHITKSKTWEEAKAKGQYDYCALKTDGFIHCSTYDQTIATANRFFKNQEGLIVLEIDETKVKEKLIYEQASDIGDDFPHIYGPLNLDAVVNFHQLDTDNQNCFIGFKKESK